MRRELLPVTALHAWADLNGIDCTGVQVRQMPDERGLGMITTVEDPGKAAYLVSVPPHLFLTLENIWVFAKSDEHLREVLNAVGEYSRTARGAILIFLLMQITHSAVAVTDKIGTSNPWTEYIKFLPSDVPLPTFWTEEERALPVGTSLEAALDAKLKSLDREFTHLKDSTPSIGWCQKYWWSTETGDLTFNDWKVVDAMYRSRALELPGTGHAMVPFLDMANHESGDHDAALYDTDLDGNAVLTLRDRKSLKADDEVTITYGDDKGACEMVFSYGFLEDTMTSARELFLELDIPDDDPLKLAKKAVLKSAPGFKLFEKDGSIDWVGNFVWLSCVNEEDGLDFRVLQTNDGEKELKVYWKDDELTDVAILRSLLEADPVWDVYLLRAIATLQGRVEQQLVSLGNGSPSPTISELDVDKNVGQTIMRLRRLEEQTMLRAYQHFEERVLACGAMLYYVHC